MLYVAIDNEKLTAVCPSTPYRKSNRPIVTGHDAVVLLLEIHVADRGEWRRGSSRRLRAEFFAGIALLPKQSFVPAVGYRFLAPSRIEVHRVQMMPCAQNVLNENHDIRRRR